MHLRLSDPNYSDRLAEVLTRLGQTVHVAAAGELEVDEEVRSEIEIYLKVWHVLYPEAAVSIAADRGSE